MKSVIELDVKINEFVNFPWGRNIAFSPIGTAIAGKCLTDIADLKDPIAIQYIKEYGLPSFL